MNEPTAFKQYFSGIPNITSGDITTGSFTDTGGGYFGSATVRIKYYKLGNLYFGFYLENTTGPTPIGTIGDNGSTGAVINDTIARIAFKIGITVNTSYLSTPITSAANDTYFCWATGGPYWTGGANTNSQQRLLAILAN